MAALARGAGRGLLRCWAQVVPGGGSWALGRLGPRARQPGRLGLAEGGGAAWRPPLHWDRDPRRVLLAGAAPGGSAAEAPHGGAGPAPHCPSVPGRARRRRPPEGSAGRWTRRAGRPRRRSPPARPSSAGSWTAPSRPTSCTRTTSAWPSATWPRRRPSTSSWSPGGPSRASAEWRRATPSSWDTCWWWPARQPERRASRRATVWWSTMEETGPSLSTTSTSTCWGGARWAGRLAELLTPEQVPQETPLQ